MGLEPTTSCLQDKGTTTCAKGEPEVVGRGSGSIPVEVHCYAAFLSGRGHKTSLVYYKSLQMTLPWSVMASHFYKYFDG